MKNELVEDALLAIRAAGFEPSIARNRHWKISWTDRRGRTRVLVVSFSSSDTRARAQSRAILRRLLAS
jgi:hypothetical protein